MIAARASSKMSPDTPMTVPKIQPPSRESPTARVSSDKSVPIRNQKLWMGPNRRPASSLVAATCWPTRRGL